MASPIPNIRLAPLRGTAAAGASSSIRSGVGIRKSTFRGAALSRVSVSAACGPPSIACCSSGWILRWDSDVYICVYLYSDVYIYVYLSIYLSSAISRVSFGCLRAALDRLLFFGLDPEMGGAGSLVSI